ncbi:DUF5615 family PIN-like protein [Candidatus Woesearchaeota archaeon]|nr:DUF5615 family PIN-like protein [Candidatus Woesearchaeota archaeon]
MKFLIDENVASSITKGLRKDGYDVKDIKELKMFGISDKEVLELANKEKRIVITYDSDFENHPYFINIKHFGIILLKFKDQSSRRVLEAILSTLKSKIADKIPNNFTIISDAEIEVFK